MTTHTNTVTTASAQPEKVREEIGEQIIVSPNAVVFVHIENDQDCANPLEDCDGMGRIHSLNSRHINSIKSQEELDELLKDKYAVALSYFEHGNCLWDVQHGERIARCPDMQWDGVSFAGVWVPDSSCREHIQSTHSKRKEAVKCAEQACKAYTSWVNGDCYYYSMAAFKPMLNKDGEVSQKREAYEEMGEELGSDSCGGFIGDDIEYMVRENIQPFVNEHTASK